jgi:hypothetical protein
VSGQRHDPAALHPRGKKSPVPTGQKAGWAPEPVWTQRLEEKSFASAGIKPQSPGRPVCSHAILAELPRLSITSLAYFNIEYIRKYIHTLIFSSYPCVCWTVSATVCLPDFMLPICIKCMCFAYRINVLYIMLYILLLDTDYRILIAVPYLLCAMQYRSLEFEI